MADERKKDGTLDCEEKQALGVRCFGKAMRPRRERVDMGEI